MMEILQLFLLTTLLSLSSSSDPSEVNGFPVQDPKMLHLQTEVGITQYENAILDVDDRNWKADESEVNKCPTTCRCRLLNEKTFLKVEDCRDATSQDLNQLLMTYKNISDLGIITSTLAKLPTMIKHLPKLVRLELIGNGFDRFPSEILEIQNLYALDLTENKIQVIPQNISRLIKLTTLDIAENMIESIPPELAMLSRLQTLNIFQNHISIISKEIGKLCNLRYVYLNNNCLSYLPSSFTKLKKLETLDLSHNKFKTVPQAIFNLTQIKWLRMNNNQLHSLPAHVMHLRMLREIQFADNMIRILPEKISKLNDLRELQLNGNLLQTVPILPERIDTLFLRGNRIQHVPCHIFALDNLVFLDLSENVISTFNCSSVQILSLHQLNISHNKLTHLPCDFQFHKILEIYASHNNFSELPESCDLLEASVKVQHLDLSFNKLQILRNREFCNQNYQSIDYSNNKITVVDPKAFSVKNCLSPSATVNLSNNHLQIIDSWPFFLSMSSSVTVDLSNNSLSNFTSSKKEFTPTGHVGSMFIMKYNQIRNFMDIFNGWHIMVDTSERLQALMANVGFDLAGNPLICNCIDYEVFKYIQGTKQKAYNGLICQEPTLLKGKNPKVIPLQNFVCQVEMDCPSGCICDEIPYYNAVNVECTNYNNSDLPKKVPSLPKHGFTYHLIMNDQNLTNISLRLYLPRTTHLLLSNNSIRNIGVNDSSFNKIKVLHLDYNQLCQLPDGIISLRNSTVVDVRLGNNPWTCDCRTLKMKHWIMQNLDMIKDKETIICHSPAGLNGRKFVDVEPELMCPNKDRQYMYIIVTVLSSVCLIVIFCLFIVDKIKNNQKKWAYDECVGEGKIFDVFVSYATEDEEYVDNYLIPELEKRDYRVCFHRVHFLGGKPIHVNISEAIAKSKRTLAFFSSAFKDSNFSMFEFHLALHLDIENNTRRLITIKDTDLNVDQLPVEEKHYFQTHTYIMREDPKFWETLTYTLPKNRLGAERY